jgi:hypothetical protein
MVPRERACIVMRSTGSPLRNIIRSHAADDVLYHFRACDHQARAPSFPERVVGGSLCVVGDGGDIGDGGQEEMRTCPSEFNFVCLLPSFGRSLAMCGPDSAK